MSGDSQNSYVAALDVGTTTIRCQIMDSNAQIIGLSSAKINLCYPAPGYVEIEPNELWNSIISTVKNAIADSHKSASDIQSLGISTQRGTFLTWRKDNGQPFHNFITWKDLRAKKLVKDINSSFSIGVLRWVAYFIYIFTRSKHYLTGSHLKVASNHVTVRLLYILSKNQALKSELNKNNVMFGTLETWLIYKFTKGFTYVTEISNASATGFYDPFDLDWGFWATKILKIPEKILPKVVDNDFEFGSVYKDIFGVSIPIGCVMSDQSSSLFGSCCFNENDLKVTLGTGAFLDINTSSQIQTSLHGMYPLVGWKINGELMYISEVPNNDCGSIIEWALEAGFIQNPTDTFELANQVRDNDGVYFIAAFSGLGPPINNEKAASGFIGIKPTTRKAHMVRAILESIVFRTALAFKKLKEERPKNYVKITVDGGVSKNDFICQLLADLTNLNIERLTSSEMSVLGVGFLAGISCGLWKNLDEIRKLRKVEKVFIPSSDITYKNRCKQDLINWKRAADRFLSWYGED